MLGLKLNHVSKRGHWLSNRFEICPAHDSVSAMFCVTFQSDRAIEINVLAGRNCAIFESKVRFVGYGWFNLKHPEISNRK